MKKVFLLLFSAGIFTTAFPQHGYQNDYAKNSKTESTDIIIGQKNGYGVYSTNGRPDPYELSSRDKDRQIQNINREFDMRIYAVRRDRYLRSSEKKRQINMLERQRNEQIWQVMNHFSKDRNAHNDDYSVRNHNRY